MDEKDLNSETCLEVDSCASYFRSKQVASKVQEYNHHDVLDNLDTVKRELNELNENLLKMSVHAHTLEVDLATQFNPETLFEMRQVEIKCQECMEITEKYKDVQKGTHETNVRICEDENLEVTNK